MIRNFTFTKNQKKEITKQSFNLLQKHNNVLTKTKRRFLKQRDEQFISGCKSNIVYGSQVELSGKQLKRLEVICKRYSETKSVSKQDKLKQIIENL